MDEKRTAPPGVKMPRSGGLEEAPPSRQHGSGAHLPLEPEEARDGAQRITAKRLSISQRRHGPAGTATPRPRGG